MKKLAAVFMMFAVMLCFSLTAFASGESGAKTADGRYKQEISGNIALLHDLDDSLSASEEEAIFEKLAEVVGRQGFSVCILISSDIGSPKTDRQSIDYADVYYENECGKDTNGILLLINNDTKYDWISTSGRCINIFTDKKLDRVFDYFYDYLESENYYKTAVGFCEAVDKCASGDSYFSKGTTSGKTEYYSDHVDIDMGLVFFMMIFVAVIGLCIVMPVLNAYKLKAVKGAGAYMVKNSLAFSVNEDKYIRTYVTHHTVSSSSGGGGGHHSSTHHSSGGGHHGGGGRHR